MGPRKEKPFGKNIKMDLNEGVNWIRMAEETAKWWALVNNNKIRAY